MKLRVLTAAALLALAAASAPPGAGADVTLKLPPPDPSRLVQLAAMPLDKPPVPLPAVGAPPLPQGLPELRPARMVSDVAQRPVAPMPPPRMLACNPVGTVFRVASELVECGRARYQRGELEPARAAFQSAVQEAGDRDLQREARYWLGETLLRLGRGGEVESVLAPVAQEDPRGDLGLFATHTLGWVALDQNDPARALPRFDTLLKGRIPVVLIAPGRHGRALALYGLKRYAEARDEWTALLGSNPPRPLAAETAFWLGDTLGRLGDDKGAVSRLSAYTAGGPQQPLSENALLSLGWWSRAAGQPADAVKAYRALLAAFAQTPSAAWARAGLVQALLDQGDYAAAQQEARQLAALDKSGALTLPSLLALRRWAADNGKGPEAQALDSELLARTLDPATRAWVLLLSAEAARQAGNSGEARDRLELVRQTPTAAAAVKQQAELRMVQLDFDARAFAEAHTAAQALLAQPLADDVRAAVLVLAAESAYAARNWAAAATAYSRFLSDFPKRPEAPAAAFALGWAELRRGRLDAARERWSAFAAESPSSPRAAEALLLAAELADKAGDRARADSMLELVTAQYPGTEPAEVARLNRAILALHTGRAMEALGQLGRMGSGGPASPYAGRARVAKGMALLAAKQPGAAETELGAAIGQGDDAIAHLGLGAIALGRGDFTVAAREFGEARDGSGGAVAAAAEYGLAAVAFNQGKLDEFKKAAGELVAGRDDPATMPYLLQGLGVVAADDKRWPEARTLALRLATQYPRSDVTPVTLAAIGSAAADAGQWPLAREMYQTLQARYPSGPSRESGRVVLGEALLRTGAPADARRELEAFAASASPSDPQRPRAMALLAEAQEAAGDRAGAAQTYARYAAEHPGGKEAPGALLGAGRLLQADGKWDEARPLLDRAIKGGDAATAAEAAYHLGEGLRAAGQNDEAAEAYLTAAYLAPDSVWARRALLGAGRAFAAAKQNDSAVIVYRKLLAASAVEPDLAAAARTGLKTLGVN